MRLLVLYCFIANGLVNEWKQVELNVTRSQLVRLEGNLNSD